MREYCLRSFDFVDLYALYHDGKIIPADRVHHIVEALEDPDRFYDSTNHFPVSDASHHEIHLRMKIEGAELVRQELFGYIRDWKRRESKG